MREVDYSRLMGVEALAKGTNGGQGVRVAVLDSGVPSYAFKAGRSMYHGAPDHFGHASEISSILFGIWAIKGVCPGAEPCYIDVLDAHGEGDEGSVASGIYRALEEEADIINLSLGFMRTRSCPKALERACDAAFEAGKPIFCAAGNDGGPVNWPAALETTICVGSADKKGQKMSFSSVGEVDFVAPGLKLPVLDHNLAPKTVSGTSFSTALVSGVAALLVSDMKNRREKVCVESVKAALKGLSRDVDASGWDEHTGFGMISADPTVDIQTKCGFFGKIIHMTRKFLGIKAKRS